MIKYLIALGLLGSSALHCCTDFVLKSNNGDIINGRSMEFGTDLESEIVFYPKNQKRTSLIGPNQDGMHWMSKHSILAVTAFHKDIITDGMNDAGLSLGLLWFPPAKYPEVSSYNRAKMIAAEDLPMYLLGNCADIQQVKRALESIQIVPLKVPELGDIPPIHFSIHDRYGKSLVIEFIDKKMVILDNEVGVLTNAPKFEWQETNLANYINLTAMNQGSVSFDGTVLHPTGQGSGLLGIPGDWTPPSRFVRIAIFKNFVKKASNAKENQNLAFHLLNTVDIPYGAIQNRKGKQFDYTQWVVVKDLSNLSMAYRSYLDLNIKEIDFKTIEARSNNREVKWPIYGIGL